jgi:hypothetical protein
MAQPKKPASARSGLMPGIMCEKPSFQSLLPTVGLSKSVAGSTSAVGGLSAEIRDDSSTFTNDCPERDYDLRQACFAEQRPLKQPDTPDHYVTPSTLNAGGVIALAPVQGD